MICVTVPIIVALNKIDKHEANPVSTKSHWSDVIISSVISAVCIQFQEAAKRALLQNGVQLEEFGGDTQVVPVSALKVCLFLGHWNLCLVS